MDLVVTVFIFLFVLASISVLHQFVKKSKKKSILVLGEHEIHMTELYPLFITWKKEENQTIAAIY